MKPILPLFIFLLMFSVLDAQTGNKAAEFFRQGMAYKDKNMLPEAYASFKKAIAADKRYDSAYVELGLISQRANNLDSALLCFKKAIAISPKMTTALIAYGNFYRYSTLNNVDSCFRYFNAALKTDSMNKLIYCNLAWCYNAKQDYENAIRFAVKALDLDNGYRQAYNELGYAYGASKKYTEALEQFKKNLSISIVDLPMYYVGLVYTQLNDKEAALKQYEELKKINEKMATKLKSMIDKMK